MEWRILRWKCLFKSSHNQDLKRVQSKWNQELEVVQIVRWGLNRAWFQSQRQTVTMNKNKQNTLRPSSTPPQLALEQIIIASMHVGQPLRIETNEKLEQRKKNHWRGNQRKRIQFSCARDICNIQCNGSHIGFNSVYRRSIGFFVSFGSDSNHHHLGFNWLIKLMLVILIHTVKCTLFWVNSLLKDRSIEWLCWITVCLICSVSLCSINHLIWTLIK